MQADKDKLAVLTLIVYFDKQKKKVTYFESPFLILDVFYICSKFRISITCTSCNGQEIQVALQTNEMLYCLYASEILAEM